jgi:hypothetical protein
MGVGSLPRRSLSINIHGPSSMHRMQSFQCARCTLAAP